MGRGAVGARLPHGSQSQPAGRPTSTWSPATTPTRSARATRSTSAIYNNGTPRDAADDNYNAFDPYPPATPTDNRLGEVDDLDFHDPAGALLLPVERMRRFVTPADINGTGRVLSGTALPPGPPGQHDVGADQWGRVGLYSYFRPPGLPGQVNVDPAGASHRRDHAGDFPWTSGPRLSRPRCVTNVTTAALTTR